MYCAPPNIETWLCACIHVLAYFSSVLCPQSLCFFEVAILLEVCVLLLWGLPTNHRPRATFLTVLQQRATSYTRWAHMNVTPSLPHSHTRPASSRCMQLHWAPRYGVWVDCSFCQIHIALENSVETPCKFYC